MEQLKSSLCYFFQDMIRTVVLQKKSSGLGMVLVGGAGTPQGDIGIFISKIVDDSVAAQSGQLAKRDQVFSVNGG